MLSRTHWLLIQFKYQWFIGSVVPPSLVERCVLLGNLLQALDVPFPLDVWEIHHTLSPW